MYAPPALAAARIADNPFRRSLHAQRHDALGSNAGVRKGAGEPVRLAIELVVGHGAIAANDCGRVAAGRGLVLEQLHHRAVGARRAAAAIAARSACRAPPHRAAVTATHGCADRRWRPRAASRNDPAWTRAKRSVNSAALYPRRQRRPAGVSVISRFKSAATISKSASSAVIGSDGDTAARGKFRNWKYTWKNGEWLDCRSCGTACTTCSNGRS